MHIDNLYKPEAQYILLFKECYALEKIHGTSAHITFKTNPSNPEQQQIVFFSGGEKYLNFLTLFDKDKLFELLKSFNLPNDRDTTIYGEAYGGKQQGMANTYGSRLKFIAFDVQIGETWLNVPNAEDFVKKLGLEFVDYVKVSTDLTSLDAERDKPSVQAVRNGVITKEQFESASKDKELCKQLKVLREGVVLRPLIELKMSNGERLISKHKGDDFRETATPRKVVDVNDLQVLNDATEIANEWVTGMRLTHVLDKLGDVSIERTRDVIVAMTEDVIREGKGEIVFNDSVTKAIGKKTVEVFKQHLNSKIKK